jgi:excisionase family DNA binding protein
MKQTTTSSVPEQEPNDTAVELFSEYPEVMNIAQVARALSICTNSVRAMIYQHQIPAKKIRNTWRILRSDLRIWITQSDN